MHEQYLLAALEQAKLGRGRCAPNPSVGAVAVKDGKIIARAWHQGAGSAHAEKLLITQFAAHTPGVTIYVTLEPCNHWGRTPPCTEAIITHGIEKVVYAYSDPNPVVAKNNTPKKLCDSHIGCLLVPVPEIETFYQSYKHWTETGLPRVTAKIAQTLDGKIAGPQGQPRRLSNEACKTFTHQLRRQADLILTSAQTINTDDPQLNVRLDGHHESKHLAVVDQHLKLNMDACALKLARHTHVFHSAAIPSPESRECVSFHPITVRQDHLDLEAILTVLGGLGYHDVFVEAGGGLFSALHKAGLVHRTYIYLVPMTLQTEATSAYPVDDVFQPGARISWLEMKDNMILCLDWPEDRCLQV